MNQPDPSEPRPDEWTLVRWVSFAFAIIAVIAAGAVFALTLFVIATQFISWHQVLEKHFAAIIGVPCAAAVAFVLVVFLRQTEGPIEFEGLGFKVKGAAGQVLMWVICFLAISGAIKWLW